MKLELAEQIEMIRKRTGWTLYVAREEEHGALLDEWIAAEPDHAGRTTASAWLAPGKGIQNLLLADRTGPLLFLRCSNVMRFDLQIAPHAELRAARALAIGMPWMRAMLRDQGYRELIGETRGPRLVHFLERIGFRESSTEHVLAL